MTITYHEEVGQGSDEWLALRCGLLTASEMKLILTPTLKTAANDKERAHVSELAAQRRTKYVEPRYISDDMLRGREDEIEARIQYDKHYARVTKCGFITNDKFGFTIGYSPDGLVESGGLLECKSRCQKYQFDTICKMEMPEEYVLQVQTGLLVSERSWVDFISYCGGLEMVTMRVYADPEIQDAILRAATAFEVSVSKKMAEFEKQLAVPTARFLPTIRKIEEQMI